MVSKHNITNNLYGVMDCKNIKRTDAIIYSGNDNLLKRNIWL